VWVVEITMPKKLMQDIYIGKENQEHNQMAELMKYNKSDITSSAEQAPEEVGNDTDDTTTKA
jgi:hypothetical protein